MSIPVFPVLPGQSFSVKKKPTMSTLVATHLSGREVRAALYQNPIWQFELAFEGLDGSPTGDYPGLGAQSLQSVLGLFLQCGGQFGAFIYYDPTDYQASSQAFGVGDGTTTSFPLVRALGGFVEPVVAPFTASALTAFALPGSSSFAPNNLIANSMMAGAVAGSPGTLPTGWSLHSGSMTGLTVSVASVSVSGLPTLTLTVSGTPSISAGLQIWNGGYDPATPGQPYVQSLYAALSNQTNVASVQIGANVYAAGPTYLSQFVSTVLPTTTLQRFSQKFTPNGAATASVEPFITMIFTAGQAVNFTLTLAGPQLETSSAAGPASFAPTWTTAYCGSPVITAAGSFVNPTGYTIANGVVTFGTAPTSGATLSWSGYFGFLCRFDSDDLDFEQFMSNLWKLDSLKFRSLRAQ
jgi:hypothetical protein